MAQTQGSGPSLPAYTQLGCLVQSSQKQRAPCPLQDSNAQATWTEPSLTLGLIGSQDSRRDLETMLRQRQDSRKLSFVTKLLPGQVSYSGEVWLSPRPRSHLCLPLKLTSEETVPPQNEPISVMGLVSSIHKGSLTPEFCNNDNIS